MERVQKIIAASGLCSRRKAEELIKQGRVKVNNKKITLGDQADPDKDKVIVDGKEIEIDKKVYLILNKPAGLVTSTKSPHNKTIMELIDVEQRVYPVGRLDKDTTGLILLTNDGTLANKIMHPSHELNKTYRAELDQEVDSTLLSKLLSGISIDGRKVKIKDVQKKGKNTIQLSIHEGRKHIVKRIFEKLGLKVKRLERTAIGPLRLGKLKRGQWRELKKEELSSLRRALQL